MTPTTGSKGKWIKYIGAGEYRYEQDDTETILTKLIYYANNILVYSIPTSFFFDFCTYFMAIGTYYLGCEYVSSNIKMIARQGMGSELHYQFHMQHVPI